jgi:hypothetical protein
MSFGGFNSSSSSQNNNNLFSALSPTAKGQSNYNNQNNLSSSRSAYQSPMFTVLTQTSNMPPPLYPTQSYGGNISSLSSQLQSQKTESQFQSLSPTRSLSPKGIPQTLSFTQSQTGSQLSPRNNTQNSNIFQTQTGRQFQNQNNNIFQTQNGSQLSSRNNTQSQNNNNIFQTQNVTQLSPRNNTQSQNNNNIFQTQTATRNGTQFQSQMGSQFQVSSTFQTNSPPLGSTQLSALSVSPKSPGRSLPTAISFTRNNI